MNCIDLDVKVGSIKLNTVSTDCANQTDDQWLIVYFDLLCMLWCMLCMLWCIQENSSCIVATVAGIITVRQWPVIMTGLMIGCNCKFTPGLTHLSLLNGGALWLVITSISDSASSWQFGCWQNNQCGYWILYFKCHLCLYNCTCFVMQLAPDYPEFSGQ